MVDELERLYSGVCMSTVNGNEVLVRAALLLVACDIPAARKVCGFTGIRSFYACHKCDRKFEALQTDPRQRNFSGFDFGSWVPRKKEANALQAKTWKNAATQAERNTLERQNGTRWSELHRLAYFDIVRCTVIDPMHNLYAGTAKRMVELWQRKTDDVTKGFLLTKKHWKRWSRN